MARFEEVQMKIAESAKRFLEIYNMQVFLEQFTLDRECKFSLTLPNIEPPFLISATASFTYDAFQTGITIQEEEDGFEEENTEVDNSIELEFVVRLPIMVNPPNIEALLEEIGEEYPDTDPILVVKEVLPDEGPWPSKDYEISYSYQIDSQDLLDEDLHDEIFEELHSILELVYRKTKDHIDISWYRGE